MTVATFGPRRWALTSVAAMCVMAFLAQYVRIGGDWDWLVAMGDHIRSERAVPDEVPFAAAPSSGWHNVPVVGEVIASLLHQTGARIPIVVQLAAVALGLVVLAAAARDRGASDGRVALYVVMTALGCFASLIVVRAQVWSLLLFPLLIWLVSSQARRPDRRIWWAVPLLVVWGNLHGAALLGLCFLAAYLVVGRLRSRPHETVAIGIASVLALAANPQGWWTPVYYATVFDNVAAERAEGLWARPSLGEPIDVIMLSVATVFAASFLRRRRDAWEYVAVLGLLAATISASRHGVWLVYVLFVLSAAPPTGGSVAARGRVSNGWVVVTAVASLAVAVAIPVAVRRGDAVLGASPTVVARVSAVADGGVVLAPAPLSEALAVAGVRVWVTNPLDAFSREDQATYLDFLAGADAGRAVERSDLVVVQADSAAQDAIVAGGVELRAVNCRDGWICYIRPSR